MRGMVAKPRNPHPHVRTRTLGVRFDMERKPLDTSTIVGQGATHITQRVQSVVGVKVTVQSMHVQIPGSFTRYARPVTLPF